jgi:hypothetical protein
MQPLHIQRPASFDGTAAGTGPGSGCWPQLRRVLPTHVVPPETWAPLPASEPAQLLGAAKRCTVQRLQLCLSLSVTSYPDSHMVEVELKAEMVAPSDVRLPRADTALGWQAGIRLLR